MDPLVNINQEFVSTLDNFNFFILKLHQRNVYNLHLLLFLTSEGKDVNKCIVVGNDSLSKLQQDIRKNDRCLSGSIFNLHTC
jgi:hypothetical protein